MARRGYPVQGHEGRLKIIDGSITLGAASIASSTFVTDAIGTVARASAGQYTLTLTDSYSALQNAQISIMAGTAVDLSPQLVSFTSNVLTFRTLAVATATDPATGSVLYITLVMKELP